MTFLELPAEVNDRAESRRTFGTIIDRRLVDGGVGGFLGPHQGSVWWRLIEISPPA